MISIFLWRQLTFQWIFQIKIQIFVSFDMHLFFSVGTDSMTFIHTMSPIASVYLFEFRSLLMNFSLFRIHLDYANFYSEFQFAFICLLYGYNYDGFDQWKMMLSLVCMCDKAIEEKTDFFISFYGM